MGSTGLIAEPDPVWIHSSFAHESIIDMTAARLTNRGRTGTGDDGGHGTHVVSCVGRLCFDVVLIHGTMAWVSDHGPWRSAGGNKESRDLGFHDTLSHCANLIQADQQSFRHGICRAHPRFNDAILIIPPWSTEVRSLEGNWTGLERNYRHWKPREEASMAWKEPFLQATGFSKPLGRTSHVR
jgi:hypothetical protein